VTSLGASALNGLGIDNDCTGNSGFDQLCQAIPGGGNTVNAAASTGINTAISSLFGKRKLLFGDIGGVVTDIGGQALNAVGIDQVILGGGDTENATAEAGIHSAIGSLLDIGGQALNAVGIDQVIPGDGDAENATSEAGNDSAVEPLLDNRKLLWGSVGGAVTSLGASALNGLGIDNDCTGNSGFDQLCQAIPGGGNTVNAAASTGINTAISSLFG